MEEREDTFLEIYEAVNSDAAHRERMGYKCQNDTEILIPEKSRV